MPARGELEIGNNRDLRGLEKFSRVVDSRHGKDPTLKIKLLLASLSALFLLTQPTLAKDTTWHTSWDAAAKQAKASKKPILINFTGSDWCGWCIRLDKEVFKTDHFKNWASKKVVLLKIDFPRQKPLPEAEQAKNQKLAEKYGVQGFPTIVFTNADGKKLSEYGYDEGGPENWTKKAEAGWAKSSSKAPK